MATTCKDMSTDLAASPHRRWLLWRERSQSGIRVHLIVCVKGNIMLHQITFGMSQSIQASQIIRLCGRVYSCDNLSPRTGTKTLFIQINWHFASSIYFIASTFVRTRCWPEASLLNIIEAITEFRARISNYIHTKQCDLIIYQYHYLHSS